MPEGNKKLNDLLKLIQQVQAKHSINPLNPANRVPMGTNTVSPGLSNTLNQFNTTAVSTTGVNNNVYNTQNNNTGLSPYAQQVLATEQQNRLDNTIVNGTRNKYSENYLQSQGRPIPGLSGTGESMVDALDLIGTGVMGKQLGGLVYNATKDIPLKTAGRVITNTISPFGYDNKLDDLLSMIKRDPKTVFKAIIKDEPIWGSDAMSNYDLAARLPVYRNLFKLDVPKNMPDAASMYTKQVINGVDTFIPNPKSPLGKQFLREINVNEPYHGVMGNYTRKFVKDKGKYYDFAGDRWDFGLNPDEAMRITENLSAQGIDVNKKLRWQLFKNSFSKDKLGIPQLLNAKNGIATDDITSLLRVGVNKHLNPTNLGVLREINPAIGRKIESLGQDAKIVQRQIDNVDEMINRIEPNIEYDSPLWGDLLSEKDRLLQKRNAIQNDAESLYKEPPTDKVLKKKSGDIRKQLTELFDKRDKLISGYDDSGKITYSVGEKRIEGLNRRINDYHKQLDNLRESSIKGQSVDWGMKIKPIPPELMSEI